MFPSAQELEVKFPRFAFVKKQLLVLESVLPWHKVASWSVQERGSWSELVRFSQTPRQLWQALRTLEARVRDANWVADWWYV